jgi:hypothetical protein
MDLSMFVFGNISSVGAVIPWGQKIEKMAETLGATTPAQLYGSLSLSKTQTRTYRRCNPPKIGWAITRLSLPENQIG